MNQKFSMLTNSLPLKKMLSQFGLMEKMAPRNPFFFVAFLSVILGFLLLVMMFPFAAGKLILSLVVVGLMSSLFLVIMKKSHVYKMQQAYEKAPYGVLFLDAQQKILSLNPTLQTFFTFAHLKNLKKTSLELFEAFLENSESVYAFERLKTYTTHRQEGRERLELKTPTGVFGLMVHVKPLARSKTLWFVEIDATPVSETIEAPLLSHFIDALSVPVLVTSAHGKIRYMNDAFLQWGGYDAKNVLHRPLSHLIEEKISLAPSQKSTLISVRHATGDKQSGTLTQVYAMNSKEQDLCFFIEPELMSPEEIGHFTTLLETIPLPAIFLDHRGMIRLSNRSFEKVVRERKILGRHLKDWIEEEHRSKLERFLQQARREKGQNQFLTVQFADKTPPIFMRIYATYLSSLGWDPMGCFLVLFYDVTEIQKREAQTLESQKLQALGQLAGGISHDFNNLLTAMLGFCDLLLQRHSPQDNSFTDIMQIKQNANRAANLVRQLLLFAKQSAPDPKPLDVRECLSEMSFLLRRLIGPKIDLQIKHDRGARMIYADQGQFEQVIMNLAINARDATPHGGELTFRTKSVSLKDPLPLLRHLLPARSYVLIEVSDTGAGISRENIEKIFTPFFSTKAPGRGTGLGLATVYQILENMGGGIQVESEIGKGTVFFIYLPRYMERKKREEDAQIEEESRGHLVDFWEEARILIVEDEDPVRLFASRALKSKGYEVWEAKDGTQGFEILQKTPRINLLITDVMMPGMDGPTLVNAAHTLNPDLRVLFVSGYPEEEIQMKLHFPKEQVYFLPKPFNLNELAVKVHDVLGAI